MYQMEIQKIKELFDENETDGSLDEDAVRLFLLTSERIVHLFVY